MVPGKSVTHCKIKGKSIVLQLISLGNLGIAYRHGHVSGDKVVIQRSQYRRLTLDPCNVPAQH